ncbi:hypothetical protein OH146_04070 [Salinibacterium sp. SYSU T00001]|uniref:hypothetical protein n=1 Tax=Homoserinimonas sedimenticola TaxID=2986805 RepID=UPI00223690BF|nr:hypothetical protein [Salinibacterium sedimenticola]MCW4384946.1 hypothetical protein [Salinibacterium sedimenticola]
MTADSDDDALRWDDDDPSHVAGPASAREGRTAPAAAEPGGTSSALLVAYGITAGIFLLYCVGWAVAVQRDDFTQPGLFDEIMYQLGEFLAIASPVIWMAAVFGLVRRSGTRLVWLIVGVLLLVPWPFVLGG